MGSAVLQDPGTRAGRRRTRLRRRRALGAVVVLAALFGAAIGARAIVSGGEPERPVVGQAADGEQLTTLVAMRLEGDQSHQADALTLFGIDRTGRRPVVMFVPVSTLAVIPGQDFIAVGKALTTGRLSLQQTTVENLLGVVVDRTVGVSDVVLGRLIDALGGIDVTVEERLLEENDQGIQELVFPLGRQHFDGATAITYLTYRAEGSSELDRFPRAQKVWEGIFAKAGPDGVALERAVRALGPSVDGIDGAPRLAEMLVSFARAPADERSYEVMPPESVGAGGVDEVLKPDEEELRKMVVRSLAGSLPPPGVGVGARVELRNGNGIPEMGERVARLLVPAGLRISITGNARRFDFDETQIVVYGDDEQALALGNKVKNLLGLGKVLVGRRPQTVVDVTVVVGRDFAERKVQG